MDVRKKLADHEKRIQQLERNDIPPPKLLDLMRSFEGGISALALASTYSDDILYRYAQGAYPKNFSVKISTAIAEAFDGRQVFGEEMTIELQRRAWERARAKYVESKSKQL